MRQIAEGFFSESPVMAAPLVAMLIFLGVFALAVVHAVRARRTEVERCARLPLEEGDDV
jgi:hypothetical protein